MPRTANALRTLSFGAVAGALLSLARAPLGLDPFSVPAVEASDAAVFRAAALLAVALCAGSTARLFAPRIPVALLLAGTALGFGLHGLVLARWWELGGYTGLFLWLAPAALAMAWLAAAGGLQGPGDAPEADPPPGWTERAGLAVAGAGAAIALESVARTLRLLGGGLPQDDSVFGLVFLVELAIGAAAFGFLAGGPRRARAILAAGLAVCAGASMLSVHLLGELSARDGLEQFLRQGPWHLHLAHQGRIWGDLLIGARVLLVPAFACGAALAAARHRGRLSSVVAGAAAGLLAVPWLVSATAEDGALAALVEGAEGLERVAALPALRVALASAAAAAGAMVAILAARGLAPAARIGGAALALAVPVILLGPLERPLALPLSPWERFQVRPKLVLDVPEGLLAVEPTTDLTYVVTLDRRRLTPSGEGEAADAQRFALSFEAAGLSGHGRNDRAGPAAQAPGTAAERAAAGARPDARILLVGQLTPARARVLGQLGAARIDRTAAWHASMERLEAELFADEELPEGEVLSPAEAERLLAREPPAFDLVVIPPVEGGPPVVELPEGAPALLWLDARRFAARRDWGERALLSSDGFDHLAVGVGFAPEGALPAGGPVAPPSPLAWLAMAPFEREKASLVAATGRLARAAEDTPFAELARGLHLHHRAQARSSPFETEAQQVELDRGGLDRLLEAALARPPDRFLRELWAGIARVLVGKREIELIYAYLEPLAERYEVWPEMEIALARADLEALDPLQAAGRLLEVIDLSPNDRRLRVVTARALLMANEPAEAASQLRAARDIQPGDREVERLLAMAMVRAGEPGGRERVEELLAEDPEDEELRAYLQEGPLPPVEPEFRIDEFMER